MRPPATSVLRVNTHTYTHPLNGPFSGITRVSRYQKGKTNLDFTEARDSEWQWHQQGHMQVCISLQTDNHASTPPLVFTGRMPFLPPNQQRQNTEGTLRVNTKQYLSTLQLQSLCIQTLQSRQGSFAILAIHVSHKATVAATSFFFIGTWPHYFHAC